MGRRSGEPRGKEGAGTGGHSGTKQVVIAGSLYPWGWPGSPVQVP